MQNMNIWGIVLIPQALNPKQQNVTVKYNG